jgi:hypothetical protein
VRPEVVELSTFWFVAVEAGNLSTLRGVAYGRFRCFSCSSVVRKLYARRNTVRRNKLVAQPLETKSLTGRKINPNHCSGRAYEFRALLVLFPKLVSSQILDDAVREIGTNVSGTTCFATQQARQGEKMLAERARIRPIFPGLLQGQS